MTGRIAPGSSRLFHSGRPSRCSRLYRRGAALAVVIATALASALVGLAASPSAFAAPSGEFATRLAFTLSEQSPIVVTADDDDPGDSSTDGPAHAGDATADAADRTQPSGRVTLVGRFTNTGPDPIDDIWFRFQRDDRLTSVEAVQQEVADPIEPTSVVNSDFRPLPGTVDAGESVPFAISVYAFGDPTSTLAITEPGVYPVMLNLNGTVHAAGGETVARVGELHVLVTVASVPRSTTPGFPENPQQPERPSREVGILWPLADRPHLALDGIFRDDDLAASIAPGGRLRTALDVVLAADAAGVDPRLVTLVIDPMLLDELDQMVGGYRVLDTVNGGQGALGPAVQLAEEQVTDEDTPDEPTAEEQSANGSGTGSAVESPDPTGGAEPTTAAHPEAEGSDPTVPGIGQRSAARFLGDLRTLATEHDVLALPYGDADLSALLRADMTDQARSAIFQGRDTVARALVVGPDASEIARHLVTDIALPPGGVMTAETARFLESEGYRGTVLRAGALIEDPLAGPAGEATAPVEGLADVATGAPDASERAWMPAVIVGGQRSQQFAQILSGDTPGDPDRMVHLLAAEFAVSPRTHSAPIVVMPSREFTPSRDGFAALTQLISDLADSGTLQPSRIAGIFDQEPTVTASLAYSDADRRSELPRAYLGRIDELASKIAVLQRALGAAIDGADPAAVLTPLQDALLPAVSAAWRGQSDPSAAALSTIDATLAWLFGGVQIMRDTGSYTLASSTAPLMLTIRNALPYEVSVGVDILGGGQTGLRVTDPGLVAIGAGPRSVPLKLETEVSRSGTFTVYAQLLGSASVTWGEPVPLTIDSRAYGPLTIVMMAVAGGVLLFMVVWRIVQRLRGKAHDPENDVIPSTAGTPTDTAQENRV